MSKVRIYKEYKTNILSTPIKYKPKKGLSMDSNDLNQFSTELNNNDNNSNNNIFIKINKRNSISIFQEEQLKKTPKEILSSLLKNKLKKSLKKLESNSKEQINTLKFIGKYYIVFEKNLALLSKGVEKKKKEDAKKKKLAEKEKKNSKQKIRSRTVQSNRKITRENSVLSNGKSKNSKNNHLKTSSTLLRGKNDNLEENTKIRSKTVRSSRYGTSVGIRAKNSKELMLTSKGSKNKNYKTKYNSPIKTTKSNEEENNRISIKDKYNTSNYNSNRINIRTKSKGKEKSINKRSKKNLKIDIDIDKDKKNSNNIKNINNINLSHDKSYSPKIKLGESDNIITSINESNNPNDINSNEKKNINLIKINKSTKSKSKLSSNEEIEDSLNDVKLSLEGVNGILNKINSEKKLKSKKIKFEKKLKVKKEENNEDNKDILEIQPQEKKLENNENENINININDNVNKEKVVNNNLGISNNNKEENNIINSQFKESINFEKRIQTIKEEITEPIKNVQNILSNIILKNESEPLNKKNEKEDLGKNNLILKGENPLINSENKILNINNNIDNPMNNDENPINNINNNDKNESPENHIENNNLINEIEKKIEEKEKKLKEEEKENIKTDSNIIHEEQLTEANQSSLNNQSSIMNQSEILAEQFVLITRDPDAPFTIENALKFEKTQYLGILDFLNLEEKMQFTGVNRGFTIERIYILNNKREEMIHSLELSQRETVEDLIMKIRLKYSKDELSKEFSEFQISKGSAKAVELLNNELYSKLFKKPVLEKNLEEICLIYRVLLAIFGEYEIANIFNEQLFWIKFTEYIIGNSNGKIGSFILEKIKGITFDHKKISFLNKLLVGMRKKIIPTYFSKICGTTGLLIFMIKDILEYCGVIINEKKTQPSRILDNLLYYKNSIDTLAIFIDNLSTIKTYRIREKKENEKENK